MQTLSFLFILLSCIAIIYQDISYRFIHISFFVLLTVACIVYSRYQNTEYATLLFTLVNLSFIGLLLVFLHLYFYIKNKRLTKVINRYLGLGDVLIWIALAFSYSLFNWILVLISSCIFGLFYWVLYNLLLKQRVIRIPLAGCMAFVHLSVVSISMVNSYNTFQDFF